MSNKINTRVQNKHDTQENWDKAVNFIPLSGEIILINETTPSINGNILKIGHAIKIGDGITPITNLPYFLGLKTSPIGAISQFHVPTANDSGSWSGEYVDCEAVAAGAIAIGIGTKALKRGSFAAGENTQAKGPYSIALGFNSITGDPDGSIAGTVRSGTSAIAIGKDCWALGQYSISHGQGSKALIDHAISIGNQIENAGEFTIGVGNKIKIANNTVYSAAFGIKNSILGASGAFTAGSNNAILEEADYSTAIGINNHISAVSAISLGRDNINGASYGIALGYNNIVGDLTITEDENGNKKITNNTEVFSAVALGYNNIVKGNYSCAFGVGLQIPKGAGNNGQVVIGRYNTPAEANLGYVFIIGNGTDTERENCHMVKRTGDAWYKRDVYVGGGGIEDINNPPKKLSTEEYVNNLIGDIDTALDEILTIQQNYINMEV